MDKNLQHLLNQLNLQEDPLREMIRKELGDRPSKTDIKDFFSGVSSAIRSEFKEMIGDTPIKASDFVELDRVFKHISGQLDEFRDIMIGEIDRVEKKEEKKDTEEKKEKVKKEKKEDTQHKENKSIFGSISDKLSSANSFLKNEFSGTLNDIKKPISGLAGNINSGIGLSFMTAFGPWLGNFMHETLNALTNIGKNLTKSFAKITWTGLKKVFEPPKIVKPHKEKSDTKKGYDYLFMKFKNFFEEKWNTEDRRQKRKDSEAKERLNEQRAKLRKDGRDARGRFLPGSNKKVKKPFMENVDGFFSKMWGWIKTGLGIGAGMSVWQWIKRLLFGKGSGKIGSLKGIIKRAGIIGFLFSTVETAINKWADFKKIWKSEGWGQAVGMMVNEIIEGFVRNLVSFGRWVLNGFLPMDKIEKWVSDGWKWFERQWNEVLDFRDRSFKWIGNKVERVEKLIVKGWDWSVKRVEDGWDWVKNKFSNTKAFVLGTEQKINKVGVDITNWLAKKSLGAFDWVKKNISVDNIANKAKGFSRSISNTFARIVDWMGNAIDKTFANPGATRKVNIFSNLTKLINPMEMIAKRVAQVSLSFLNFGKIKLPSWISDKPLNLNFGDHIKASLQAVFGKPTNIDKASMPPSMKDIDLSGVIGKTPPKVNMVSRNSASKLDLMSKNIKTDKDKSHLDMIKTISQSTNTQTFNNAPVTVVNQGDNISTSTPSARPRRAYRAFT